MFKTILVPVDPAEIGFRQGSHCQGKAVRQADYGTKVHVLAVCPDVQSLCRQPVAGGFSGDQEKFPTPQEMLKKVAAEIGEGTFERRRYLVKSASAPSTTR